MNPSMRQMIQLDVLLSKIMNISVKISIKNRIDEHFFAPHMKVLHTFLIVIPKMIIRKANPIDSNI